MTRVKVTTGLWTPRVWTCSRTGTSGDGEDVLKVRTEDLILSFYIICLICHEYDAVKVIFFVAVLEFA